MGLAGDASTDPQGFDTAAYDAERLRQDEEARQAMREKAKAVAVAEQKLPGSAAGAWKWEIRKRIWDFMEENNIARFPRPVHHRIPNFVDADSAAHRLSQLPEFTAAQCIKVNPDTPQKMVRYHVLAKGKTLLSPQPRLRTGFFSRLVAKELPSQDLATIQEACTSAGVAKYGQPLSLDTPLKVDLIVVGSSAVDPSNGARLGKGEGFAELEYGILRWMGAIDDSTLVVTTVHDCQVLEPGSIDAPRMLEHDVPVDVIVTPTRVIRTNTKLLRPSGILWHKLSPEKLGQIRVLRELKQRLEAQLGHALPTGPSEVLPPLASRGNNNNRRGGGGGRGRGRGGRGAGSRGGATASGGGRGSGSSK